GKSTTLNYIDERDMFEKTIPIPGFTIGHRKCHSETLHISSFVKDGVVFCECSGFDDTQGLETDSATAVGIHRTVISAKSVRIVLLIEAESVKPERGQIFKRFVELIERFVKQIDEHLPSIQVFFTKAESTTSEKLKNAVGMVFRELKTSNPKTASFVMHTY